MTAVRCSRVGMTETTHERKKLYVLVKIKLILTEFLLQI